MGAPVTDLQQPPRADAQEAVPAQPLPALDGLEQVRGRHAVVEAEEGADGRLEVRRACGTQQDSVGATGEALGLGQAQRIGHGSGPQKNEIDLDRPCPGRKVEAFRGATHVRRCRRTH